jgi:hypothetical protein
MTARVVRQRIRFGPFLNARVAVSFLCPVRIALARIQLPKGAVCSAFLSR